MNEAVANLLHLTQFDCLDLVVGFSCWSLTAKTQLLELDRSQLQLDCL